MKWLGLVTDPKDLTTKEYVDDADTALADDIKDTNNAVKALDESKVNSEDLQSFTEDEIQSLWNKHIN